MSKTIRRLRAGARARLGAALLLLLGLAGWGAHADVAGAATGSPPEPDAILRAAVEDDWRRQDGIGTPREPAGYREAVERALRRGDRLLEDLRGAGLDLAAETARWAALSERFASLSAGGATEAQWEALWREVHWLRREVSLKNPLFPTGPIALIKQIPSIFSHQLTQYYGSCARPGGGVCLLPAPGRGMECRALTKGKLPPGSCQHLDVSHDGSRLLFAYCRVDSVPNHREEHLDRFYHLHEIGVDGSGLRQLTFGPFDDFAPRYLPDGRIVFISTRRGGYHRCGRGPCPVYTLALAEADGSNPRPISFHETHEWDPAVLEDGSLIYTRWDYVDRNAVHYQQLWIARPDGAGARAFYGNNTWNPVGIWEARAVPGSHRVMATAAAHHAMTAGSIILVDPRRGIDGPAPIERLTPDVLFPESESPVARRDGGAWNAGVVDRGRLAVPVEERRWPGHCYRSPCPLSEKYFLAAYSYERLLGEPDANEPNQFGIYLCDVFGNKELLYRDPEISSLWPEPVRARPRPPSVPSIERVAAAGGPAVAPGANPTATHPASLGAGAAECVLAVAPSGGSTVATFHSSNGTTPGGTDGTTPGGAGGGATFGGAGGTPVATVDDAGCDARPSARPRGEGRFLLQNVYAAWPALPPGSVRRLRIVQVLPKATPHINDPPVGLANASPGKQVLGTVPVEADGSAHFVAPAGVPLAFQALDDRGRAVQMMRSLVYLQPGETLGCVGCHEPRDRAPGVAAGAPPRAALREASRIEPGPAGSMPLSFPILVQPILDRKCVGCHGAERAEGNVVLVGRPEGHYTTAYLQLAPRVPFSAWNGAPQANGEPVTVPGRFGARASRLMDELIAGHEGVVLDPAEIEALATWMDANALFYGSFDRADQQAQLRGEAIAGPSLE